MDRVRWIVLFSLAVVGYGVSAWQLEQATMALSVLGAAVPDLMRFETADAYQAAFAGMSAEASRVYLRTLWTWDILFPVSYASVLFLVMHRDFGRVRFLPWFAAGADLCENVIATEFLTGTARAIGGPYAVANGAKWSLLGFLAIVALYSVLLYALTLVMGGAFRPKSRST